MLSPRSRWLKGLRKLQARVEYHFMLPGLRFLFVAIVLSLSMMIFGLGAAALLRSAHQEFASLPTRHVQPEMVFAQSIEASRPTLAMLSVDARAIEQNGIDRPAVPDAPNPLQQQPSPIASIEPDHRVAAEPDRLAAQTTASSSEEKSECSEKSSEAPVRVETAARIEVPAPLSENKEPETQKRETQAALSPEPAAPAAVGTTTAAVETKTAAVEMTTAAVETTAAAVATTAAASEPTSAPTDVGATPAAVKTATLGGPAVTIEPQTASKTAVATPGKRAQARRPVRRRRIARARVLPQQPAAQPADQQAPAQFFATARPGG
jgi:hypothetical protein